MTDETAEAIYNRTSSAGITPMPLPMMWYVANVTAAVEMSTALMRLNPYLKMFLR